MKRKLWCAVRVIVVFVLVACMSGSLINENYAANLEDEKEKQEEMQDKLKDTKSHLKELENLKDDAEAYMTALDEKIGNLTENIYELEQTITAKEAVIEEARADVDVAQAEVDEQYNAMKLRIKYMYENNQNSYMTMLFESDSMIDFVNRAEYLAQITTYDREQLEKLEETTAELNAKKEKLEQEQAELQATLAEIQEEKTASEELLEAKKSMVSEYESEISGAESDIKNLMSDIETQKAIVAELEAIEKKREQEKQQNQQNQITYGGGTMAWPLPGYSTLSSYFGTRPNPFGQATQEYHSGIDIPAPSGTKIVAAADGQVAWSYYSSSAGNWVGIDHGNGIYTVYMHMSKRLVSEGDWVTKGEVIGLVGTTGRSTGNHLHFGVRKNGSYVDPLDWVSP